MTVRTMSQMWKLLDAHTLDAKGQERPINVANEWGGFSRREKMPVFTAWFDLVKFDKATGETTAKVCDGDWLNKAGVNNQEHWLNHAEATEGPVAFFIIHAVDKDAYPRNVASIDAERLFVGRIHRDQTKTFVIAKPRPL